MDAVEQPKSASTVVSPCKSITSNTLSSSHSGISPYSSDRLNGDSAAFSWVHTEKPELARINKTRLFAFQILYSFADAFILHPLTIAQTVAENHKKELTPEQLKTSLQQRTKHSFRNNLSIYQGIRQVTFGKSCSMPQIRTGNYQASGIFALTYEKLILFSKTTGVYARACFTGFPVLFTSLCLYDSLQFLPQAYLTEKACLSPSAAGAINATTVALICTPLTVIYRQQVILRCNGTPHFFVNAVKAINGSPNGATKILRLIRKTYSSLDKNQKFCWFRSIGLMSESRLEGIIPRYYRGLLGSLLLIPQAGISWGLYECSKDWLQVYSQSSHVWTNLVGGGLSGGIGTVITRPLGAVVARKQNEPERVTYREIIVDKMWKQEGPGAFYKGLGARVLLSIPRMAVFYSAYSLCMTWAMNPGSLQNTI